MLELQQVNAFYDQSHVLHDISLRLEAGRCLTLLGRNGAGKSTLLKSIIKGGPEVRGRITWAGRDLSELSLHERARSGVSLVPEDRRLITTLTVRDNILLGLHGAGRDRKSYNLDEVCDLFPMCGPLLDRKGYQLSGGQQQMVAIARGVISNPALLLLDEPAEGLAPVIVDELSDCIVNLRRQTGMTLIVTEQNIHFGRLVSEQLAVLDVGYPVFSGVWGDLDRDPHLLDRYLAL